MTRLSTRIYAAAAAGPPLVGLMVTAFVVVVLTAARQALEAGDGLGAASFAVAAATALGLGAATSESERLRARAQHTALGFARGGLVSLSLAALKAWAGIAGLDGAAALSWVALVSATAVWLTARARR